MTEPIVIGISGRKGSGKDTVAKFIEEFVAEYHPAIHYQRRAFADALKIEVAELLTDNLPNGWDTDFYTALLAKMNTVGEKELFRTMLQFWGSEYRRDMCGNDYWVDKVKDFIESWSEWSAGRTIFTIPDVRFKNEADFVHNYENGFLINVDRFHTVGDDNHISETAMNSLMFDYDILNTSGLDALKTEVYSIMRDIMGIVE